MPKMIIFGDELYAVFSKLVYRYHMGKTTVGLQYVKLKSYYWRFARQCSFIDLDNFVLKTVREWQVFSNTF